MTQDHTLATVICGEPTHPPHYHKTEAIPLVNRGVERPPNSAMQNPVTIPHTDKDDVVEGATHKKGGGDGPPKLSVNAPTTATGAWGVPTSPNYLVEPVTGNQAVITASTPVPIQAANTTLKSKYTLASKPATSTTPTTIPTLRTKFTLPAKLDPAAKKAPETSTTPAASQTKTSTSILPNGNVRDTPAPTPPITTDTTVTLSGVSLEGRGETPHIRLEQLLKLLQQRGRLSEMDLARTRHLASDGGEPIHKLLTRFGLVAERDLLQAMADLLRLPIAEAKDYPATPALEQGISRRFMKDCHLVPLVLQDGCLTIAVADPLDPFPIQAVMMATGFQVQIKIGLPEEIEIAIERLYGDGQTAMAGISDGIGGSGDGVNEEDISHLKDMASEAPVIRLVNLVIQRAVDARASDIHIEPFEGQLKVRYRIDGVLQNVEAPPARSTAAVISRVKIMAKLNIAERRLPQDGRIPLRVQGKELDLRVSTVPTLHGESVVMRLLDKASVRFDFDVLGFDGTPREQLLSILERPHGIILVTGPTGSGKSTTLYTALSRINTPESKIITVEDPVEYQLVGINQIQVKPQIGMTFANALRAIVRQDPDIIMVGEMRDLETAHIAVQSALTGHLVLSTLHTNNAAGGISRLLDMGVEDYLLTSTINGIVGQRLVRRLCKLCRKPYTPPVAMQEKLHDITHKIGGSAAHLFQAGGCEACSNTGYFGRLAIAEVLIMSDTLRQTVLRHATATEIQRTAHAEGMATMYEDGIRKVLAGLTTIEEVMRVTQSDDNVA